jgi:hypothetical protein
MTKNVVLAGFLFCSFIVYADVVPITCNYTGQVEANFKRGSDTYSLSSSTTNGTTESFRNSYPYAGGVVIVRPKDFMTPNGIQITSLFFRSYRSASGYAQCWGTGYIEGSLQIGETSQYPKGTPLDLRIDYATAYIGGLPSYYNNREVLCTDQNYNTLWYANYETPAYAPETSVVPIVSGETYYFWILQEFGSASNPIIPEGFYAAFSTALDFSVVPEPCTVLLLGFGGLLIRKR